MDWQDKDGILPSGERLIGLYQQHAPETEYRKAFGSEGRISSLERTARELIERYGPLEIPENPEEGGDLVGEVRRAPRILHFDIETTDLDPTYGNILMMGYGWQGEEEVQLVSILDFKTASLKPFDKDRKLVARIKEILETSGADVLSGHFSKPGKFDVPFINTRLLYHGLQPLQEIDHIDTQAIMASIRGKTEARTGLDNTAQFLNPEDAQKDKIPKRIWYNAQHGDIESLRIIGDYCKQDVRAQRAMLHRLLPFARQMDLPSAQLLADRTHICCSNPLCGSENVRRVYPDHTTRTMKYAQYKCQEPNCGKNMRGRLSVWDRNIPRLMG